MKFNSIFLVLLTLISISIFGNQNSNRAEVLINSSVDEITNYLIDDLIDYDYSIVTQTTNSLVLQRTLNLREEFAVGLTIGNSYSNNFRVSKFTFINTSEGVRVIWKQYFKAVMTNGQVNEKQIIDKEMTKLNLEELELIKKKLEKKNPKIDN